MPSSTVSSTTSRRLWAERARRHPDDPLAWRMAHRVVDDGGQLQHLPALAAIARDRSPLVVIQKSAQVGATELLVDLALWAADSAYAGRGNVLYLMPTQNQMEDFSQARFDRAIQDSPYLRSRLQPEPPRRKGADSKRLKRIGPGYIFLRGTESLRQIASVDADLVVLDEYDQMDEGVLDLARKRIASSRAGRIVVASTPRLPEAGINALFQQSDQHRYWLACSACGLEQTPAWDANVDAQRVALVCAGCHEPLETRVAGRWVAAAPGNPLRGYHMSRLLSPWVDLGAMVEASRSRTPSGLQEFYNSDLGEPFFDPGAGLSPDILDRCRDDYDLQDYKGQACTMGVDVGLVLHVVVRECPSGAQRDPLQPRRLWFAGTVDRFEELEPLITRFNVGGIVVDAQPELHKAAEFVQRHAGLARVAWYGRPDPGCEWVAPSEGAPPAFRVNRTGAIEQTLQRFRDGVARLPRNARLLGGARTGGAYGEYYRELLALQRRMTQEKDGNWVARWEDRGHADHYAHAEAYCLFAEQLVPAPGVSAGILDGVSRWAPLRMTHAPRGFGRS